MEETLSVAKGVFVYRNGFSAVKSTKKKPAGRKRRKTRNGEAENIIEGIRDQLWYQSFRKLWMKIESEIQDLLDANYSQVLANVRDFLEENDRHSTQDLFPVAVLLTGINQPDHYEQFELLAEKICENPAVRSSILMSRDASTLKSAIEHVVSGFICDDLGDASDEEDGKQHKAKIRKGNCIMRSLRDWYLEKREARGEDFTLTIIIPDFELFNKDVLRDLILTVSYYRAQIPLVLVFGVATTVSALENSLPLQFTSKAKFHVFKTQSSINNLNSIVEKIVLDPRNYFMLSGKTLQLLVEIFLFYDFSISGFIQGLKFAILEHFSSASVFGLCDELEVALARADDLTEDDVEDIRKLMSVRKYVEARTDPQDIVKLLCDDDYFVERMKSELLPRVFEFMDTFNIALRSLHILLVGLPKSPYGKLLREMYCMAAEGIDFESEEFQSTLNVLQFSTKFELLSKISQIEKLIGDSQNNVPVGSKAFDVVLGGIRKFRLKIEDSSIQVGDIEMTETHSSSPNLNVGSRLELKERLLEMHKKQQNQRSPYQAVVVDFLTFLRKAFLSRFLTPLRDGPTLIELFLFSDSQALRKHVVGAPRAAVHQAMMNPQHYLQCDCCELESISQLTDTQPDLSIVYKLHLECGKMINLYDWLQAFKAIVCANDDEDDDDSNGRHVDPIILARFSKAVSELQFLGFIKSSKRKTDHVNRLTW